MRSPRKLSFDRALPYLSLEDEVGPGLFSRLWISICAMDCATFLLWFDFLREW